MLSLRPRNMPVELRRKRRHLSFFLLASLIFPASLGCHSAPPARHYDLKGKVVSVDVKAKTVTVDHGEIPGLMKAMAMEYPVADESALSRLAPGDEIKATVTVDSEDMRLENISVVQAHPTKP